MTNETPTIISEFLKDSPYTNEEKAEITLYITSLKNENFISLLDTANKTSEVSN